MYKILAAKEMPCFEGGESQVIIVIDIEGYTWGLHFPAEITKEAISEYIEREYAEILRQAQIKAGVPENKAAIRYDLIDTPPASQHLAIIKSIDITKAKPVTVTRTCEGIEFDVPCIVTQDVKDQFIAGDIAVGDIVITTYFEERSDQAIITGKIFKSW